MKVVLDTNVIISAVLGGACTEVLDLLREEAFELILSTPILDEYLKVLQRPRFKLPLEVVEQIGQELALRATFVTPHELLEVVDADPSDNKFLEAAVEAGAEFVVSGDDHLLDLGVFRSIPVVRVRTFLDHVKARTSP